MEMGFYIKATLPLGQRGLQPLSPRFAPVALSARKIDAHQRQPPELAVSACFLLKFDLNIDNHDKVCIADTRSNNRRLLAASSRGFSGRTPR
jgi:hypothetical protein